MKVFRLCSECNKEFEITNFDDYIGIAMRTCPFCEKTNHIWIRVEVLDMNINQNLMRYIEETCDVNEISGGLTCQNCGSPVVIDWFEQQLECQGCDEL